MVTELSSGPFLAIEIGCNNSKSPYSGFRQLCGPFDPVCELYFRHKENEISFICLFIVGDRSRDTSKNDPSPFWCGYN